MLVTPETINKMITKIEERVIEGVYDEYPQYLAVDFNEVREKITYLQEACNGSKS